MSSSIKKIIVISTGLFPSRKINSKNIIFIETPENTLINKVYWIQKKIISFAHQELNHEKFTNLSCIKEHIKKGSDLYFRGGEETIRTVPISENAYLPTKYGTYLVNFLGN